MRLTRLKTALAIAIGFTLPHTVHAYSLGSFQIHGFASQGYIKSSDNNYLVESEEGDAAFNELGINLSTAIGDQGRIGMQLFSRDLGEIGNNDINLDWAYFDYSFRQQLGVRLGRLKSPLGLYNEIQDYDLLRSSILLPQSVYNLTWRESMVAIDGGALYGNITLGDSGQGGDIDYQLFGGITRIEEDGGIAKMLLDNDGITLKEATVNGIYGASLKWNTPLAGLLVGLSGMRVDLTFDGEMSSAAVTGDPAAAALPPTHIEVKLPQLLISVLSLQYNYNDLTLTAEYGRQRDEEPNNSTLNLPEMLQSPPIHLSSPGRDSAGYYLQASYRLNDSIEIGSYYSMHYFDRRDKSGSEFVADGEPDYFGWSRDIALSTRYDITPYWSIKAEAHRINGGSYLFHNDNRNTQGEVDIAENWQLYLLKTSVSF
ncbi:hypothetical protein D5085_02930 [Ectothiorhodospiraceae bacterium BW-2]|nr:hypothetical protein D5085_02930 [Ectothiorhodospiraceae bacterium BW-2]